MPELFEAVAFARAMDGDDAVSIVVRLMSGKTLEVCGKGSMKVKDVKRSIAAKLGGSVSSYGLVSSFQKLDDNTTLAAYGLTGRVSLSLFVGRGKRADACWFFLQFSCLMLVVLSFFVTVSLPSCFFQVVPLSEKLSFRHP